MRTLQTPLDLLIYKLLWTVGTHKIHRMQTQSLRDGIWNGVLGNGSSALCKKAHLESRECLVTEPSMGWGELPSLATGWLLSLRLPSLQHRSSCLLLRLQAWRVPRKPC